MALNKNLLFTLQYTIQFWLLCSSFSPGEATGELSVEALMVLMVGDVSGDLSDCSSLIPIFAVVATIE